MFNLIDTFLFVSRNMTQVLEALVQLVQDEDVVRQLFTFSSLTLGQCGDDV